MTLVYIYIYIYIGGAFSFAMKLRLYYTLTVTITIHADETWNFQEGDIRKLTVTEIDCSSHIYIYMHEYIYLLL